MSSPSKVGSVFYAGLYREKALRRHNVKPRKPPFEFKEVLPMVLDNTVSGKHDKVTKVSCLQEMSVMFTCFKKHDFNQAKCSSEIAAFDKCAKDYRESQWKIESEDKSGTLVPGRTVLNSHQLNVLLRKYPHSLK